MSKNVAKINFNNNILIDTTNNTVIENALLLNQSATNKYGNKINGKYVISEDDYYATSLSTSTNGIFVPSLNNVYTSAQVQVLDEDDFEKKEIEFLQRTISYCKNNQITTVGSFAFYQCYTLTSVNFPNATSIGGNAFAFCYALTSVNFPNATNIRDSAFAFCYALTSVNFPNVTYINTYAFNNCSLLTSVNFPNATTVGSYAFHTCRSLISVNSLNVATINPFAFYQCYSLTSVNFPNITTIKVSAFAGCSSLTSVYLLNSSVATGETNIFTFTPLSLSSYLGYFGSIYVRESLLSSWQTATNWAAYSQRFVGLTDGEIEALNT